MTPTERTMDGIVMRDRAFVYRDNARDRNAYRAQSASVLAPAIKKNRATVVAASRVLALT